MNSKLRRFYNALFAVLFLAFLLFVWPKSNLAATSDITGHWAEATINEMIEKGITSGYPDGTFKPDNKITRAEFTALIVRAFNLEAENGKEFTDLLGHWAKEVIATANAHGIINGYDELVFRPDEPITREQMAVMMINALRGETNLLKRTNLFNYSDIVQTAAWAQESVEKAVLLGIVNGYPDSTFKPQANTTRAEAIAVLSRSLDILPRLTPEKLRSDFDQACTYGAKAEAITIKGDATVSADGVRLQNLVIDGDLTITEAVGDGEVTLDNVTVNGTTTISGGGVNSIHINGGSFGQIVVNNTPTRIVRIVTVDLGNLDVVISEKAVGQKVILEGLFNSVEVQANGAELSTQGKTTIGELKVGEDCSDVTINLPAETKVSQLMLQSPATVNNAKDTVATFLGNQLYPSVVENRPKTTRRYNLTLGVNDEDQGRVSGGGRYKKGAVATVTAIPEPGYTFARWFLDGEVLSAESTLEYTVTGNETLSAYFIQEGYVAVATAEDLANIETALDGDYIQIADIDLGVAPYNEGTGWEPIGAFEMDGEERKAEWVPFTGSFDGNGYQISNLTINNPELFVGGLFVAVDTEGELKDITLVNVDINLRTGAGALVTINQGIIRNCVVSGSVAGKEFIGGLVGENTSDGQIISCQVSGSVTGIDIEGGESNAPSIIGGLVAENGGTITACRTDVEVIAMDGDEEVSENIGGIAGCNSGQITDTHAYGSVRGGIYVAGLVGDHESGSIGNCSAWGDVEGIEAVGGLVGRNEGDIAYCYAANSGLIRASGTNTTFGRICGDNQGEESLLFNFADKNMEAPFAEAFSESAHDGKDGQDSDPEAVAAINGAVNSEGGISESDIAADVFTAAGLGEWSGEDFTWLKTCLDEAAQDAGGNVNWFVTDITRIIERYKK